MIQPLWFYRWVSGQSMQMGAIIQNGKTLYGPVPPNGYSALYGVQ